MTRRVCVARATGAPRSAGLAFASMLGAALGCQVVLDLGQYRLDDGIAGAAGSPSATANGGAAGGAPEADGGLASAGSAGGPASAGGAADGIGGGSSGAAGSASSVGVDGQLSDAGTADASASDAGVPPAACHEDGDCEGGAECVEAVCNEGQCVLQPSDAIVACGDALDSDCTHPDRCDGAGLCLPNHVSRGTAVSAPDGDCHVVQCDGQGQSETVNDNDDVPADPGTGCTQPACLAGSRVEVP
ncbi:MAG TPA: hypothetical protein VMG12_43045, partial [Polyangiaceae bacterium]|nr:hypothetical protein [Polyangiaceae bacterium]